MNLFIGWLDLMRQYHDVYQVLLLLLLLRLLLIPDVTRVYSKYQIQIVLTHEHDQLDDTYTILLVED